MSNNYAKYNMPNATYEFKKMTCPKCKKLSSTICDNSCGTFYCSCGRTFFCIKNEKEFYLNGDGIAVVGHHPNCGDYEG